MPAARRSDCSLFLLWSTWAIILAVVTSNVLYSCNVTCTWSPSKVSRLSPKPYMTPNLSRSFKGNSLTNGDSDQGEYKRRSLGTMLALSVDERRKNNDYYGLV